MLQFSNHLMLTIEQISHLTGVRKCTLRYWEKSFHNCLKPSRTHSNRRSIPWRIWNGSRPSSSCWNRNTSPPMGCACACWNSSRPRRKASGGARQNPAKWQAALSLKRGRRPGDPASGPIPLRSGSSRRPPARSGGFPYKDRAGPPAPPRTNTGAGGRTSPPVSS